MLFAQIEPAKETYLTTSANSRIGKSHSAREISEDQGKLPEVKERRPSTVIWSRNCICRLFYGTKKTGILLFEAGGRAEAYAVPLHSSVRHANKLANDLGQSDI